MIDERKIFDAAVVAVLSAWAAGDPSLAFAAILDVVETRGGKHGDDIDIDVLAAVMREVELSVTATLAGAALQ